MSAKGSFAPYFSLVIFSILAGVTVFLYVYLYPSSPYNIIPQLLGS